MKNLLIIIFAITSNTLLAQEVWVANNNFNAPTGDNVFATIQSAVNAASAGDIVQVQPSPITYGNVAINKQLTLMGIGFNVDKDIPLQSNMGYIILTNNADNTSDADGTIIKGLNFTILYPATNTGPAYVLENILIKNCRLQYVRNASNYSSIDGFEIRDCYVTAQYNYGIQFERPTTNTIIRNNLIMFGVGFMSTSPGSNIITNNIIYDGINVNAEGTNTTILNNNFIASSGGDAAFVTELKDCIVANNIFYGMTPSIANGGNSTSTAFQRNVFTNNLVFSTGDDVMPPSGGGAGNSGSGNITGSTPDFGNSQLLNTWSSAYDFTLQGGPAINGGSDGTDIGISGGSYPFPTANFILKTTDIPVIQILNTSTVINPGDDLPVRIKAKSN